MSRPPDPHPSRHAPPGRRLPPGEASLPVRGAPAAGWVAKSVLFSMSEHMRVLKRKLQDCELRCTAAQEYEDTSAFLAALNGGGGGGGGDGSGSEAGALVVPLAARVIPAKRKHMEEAEGAAVMGSASKAARGSGQAAAGGAAAAAAAAAGEQPASTQQTGGLSTQSRRTDLSEVGKPKRVAGRGRGPDPSKTQIARRG